MASLTLVGKLENIGTVNEVRTYGISLILSDVLEGQ